MDNSGTVPLTTVRVQCPLAVAPRAEAWSVLAVWVAMLACAGEPPRQPDTASHRASNDSVRTPAPVTTPSAANAANAIKGTWWSAEQPQSAAFQIKDSTIYFPDMFVEFRYELKGDTLLLHRDDGDVRWIITRVTADTLVVALFERQDTYTRAEPTKP